MSLMPVAPRSKDVRLPVQLQRAMAAEAEAAREARAKVIAAEGEQRASRALKEAADVINESPAALQVTHQLCHLSVPPHPRNAFPPLAPRPGKHLPPTLLPSLLLWPSALHSVM